MTQKFKIGDKVRVINPIHSVLYNGYNVGDVFQISAVFSKAIETVDGPRLWHREVEKVSKKKERISALEAQVAELTAKVEALGRAQKPSLVYEGSAQFINGERVIKVAPTYNEQRKAIIAEAKAFVDDALIAVIEGHGVYRLPNGSYVQFETIVNAEKRTVVVLAKSWWTGNVRFKYKAKCAPDDVFNADIGKAIALGRALGLNVKRFEQAVKPTEVVVGMGVKSAFGNKIYRVVADYEVDDKLLSVDFCIRHKLAITDDTDAQY